MNTPGLITALLLPAILGTSWLQLFWRDSHIAARFGYGYLLGIFSVTTLLRIWDSMGLSLHFIPISTLIIVLSLVPLVLCYRLALNPTSQSHNSPFDASWQKVVWGLLLTILIIRYGGILFEIIWRPLYPWDAWMNWAPKAKTWFELAELTPYVSRADWIAESVLHNTYTLGNLKASTYPPLVPLIQTWTALGMGSWIDNTVNIPWIMCSIALALSFYGQARMIGVKPLAAQLWVYLLLSIPYINTHIALAGYAELWLAAFYCLAAMSFMNWALTKDITQGILMIVFAAACTQTKEPGIVWAITLMPAIILAILPAFLRYAAVIFIALGMVAWIYSGGFSIEIPKAGILTLSPELIAIPGLGKFVIESHAVGHSFVSNDLIWSNWHLLGWLMLVLLIPTLIRNISIQPMLPSVMLISCGIPFIAVVFFFTHHYGSALNNTTINRATIHLLPVILYYLMLSLFQDSKKIKLVTA